LVTEFNDYKHQLRNFHKKILEAEKELVGGAELERLRSEQEKERPRLETNN
jgi:hypothetical protein